MTWATGGEERKAIGKGIRNSGCGTCHVEDEDPSGPRMRFETFVSSVRSNS